MVDVRRGVLAEADHKAAAGVPQNVLDLTARPARVAVRLGCVRGCIHIKPATDSRQGEHRHSAGMSTTPESQWLLVAASRMEQGAKNNSHKVVSIGEFFHPYLQMPLDRSVDPAALHSLKSQFCVLYRTIHSGTAFLITRDLNTCSLSQTAQVLGMQLHLEDCRYDGCIY